MIHLNRLHFLGSRPTGAGGHLLSFRPESGIRFTAGQHGLWLVPGGGAAPFSIASAPQDETIELGTVLHDANRTKSALSALQPGDTVRLLGPLGRLAPPPDGHPIVLVAQGIGITPRGRSCASQPSPTAHSCTLARTTSPTRPKHSPTGPPIPTTARRSPTYSPRPPVHSLRHTSSSPAHAALSTTPPAASAMPASRPGGFAATPSMEPRNAPPTPRPPPRR